MHDHTVGTTRYFTPDEANELLPAVRPLVEQMVEHHGRLARALQRREALQGAVAGNGGNLPPRAFSAVEAEIEAASESVARCARAIHELGGQVKDPEQGLVDFPSVRDGEEVLLCWHLGEDHVGHWHGLNEGFAGRRTLPD